jgi:hypothetical protein
MTRGNEIRIIHYGLGPIGIEAARLAARKANLRIVGAIDIAEDKAGRDLGSLLGLPEKMGIKVSGDPADLFSKVEADVVVHTTSSFLERIYSQLAEIVAAGLCVISSAEELLYPRLQHPDLAAKLDQVAQKYNVAILGTGVNPGFVLDTLPLILSSVCEEAQKIEAYRVVDASTRREPLQRKIGAGMSESEFRERVARKELGHIGLIESLALVAEGLNWQIDNIDETIDPVIAQRSIKTRYVAVSRGQVAGIHHVARGLRAGQELILLDLKMYIGAENPHDRIVITGNPALQATITGGVAGDQATAAMLINLVPIIKAAPPGLRTMLDIPLPRFRS